MPARLQRLFWRILIGGLAASLLVYGAGRAFVDWRLGDDQAILRNLEADTRRNFTRDADRLQAVAEALARSAIIRSSLEENSGTSRSLFAAITRVLESAPGDEVAATVYDGSGRPIAWNGRPSEIPPERVQAPRNLFVAQGPLGLRLVATEPVMSGDTPARRVGTVAAERRLSTPDPTGGGDAFVLPTSFGPVTLRRTFRAETPQDRPGHFLLRGPNGTPLLEASVEPGAPAATRARWLQRVESTALAVAALTLLLLAALLALARSDLRQPRRQFTLTLTLLLLIAAARVLLWQATPPAAWATDTVRSWFVYSSKLLPHLHRSPIDLLVSGLLLGAAVLALIEPLRALVLARRRRRTPSSARPARLAAVSWQLAAGLVVLGLELLLLVLVQDTAANSDINLLRLAVLPWEPPRLALLTGLVLLQVAAVWGGVIVCRIALASWHRERVGPLGLLLPAAWALPGIVAAALPLRWTELPRLPMATVAILVAFVAWTTRRGIPWFRHGSQAARLGWLLLALLIPALALYPSLVAVVERAKQQLIETQYALQVQSHPADLTAALARARSQIDAFPGLVNVMKALERSNGTPPTEPAFSVWRSTDLETERLTSAIELYLPDGTLASRFALNLPESEVVPLRYQSTTCDWEVFGEAQPFGADERRMLHAERAVCAEDGNGGTRVVGTIVAHVMLDYSALPFISSQSPYFEFIRAPRATREGMAGSDVELTVFGWGRLPIYTSSNQSWLLTDAVFERAYASRAPFWTTLTRGDTVDRVYVSNDRNGIYVIGYPVLTAFNHLVHLGELTSLVAVLFVALMMITSLVRRLLRRGPYPAQLLIREIRASFYRKLFIAFVAATLVPVLALALLVRAYVASQLRDDVEAEAARTALTAKRVIEESLALQQREVTTLTSGLSDDVMVWISRVIDQDVNIFDDAELMVTSERDLFASGLLPTRTPDSVYQAVRLERQPTYVGQDRIGDFTYLVAAAPVRVAGLDAMLTVPLASRQREIEREIDELDRGVLLGALVLILLGAGLGYWMAERIGDPVQRLTRATRRIAAGDLSTRVIVRTADELQRLVEAFNRMAGELQRQRQQLERTHRLEAWAEMARQVAHDIKNPLTPIQLSAEHLRRVHQDRGRPLDPVLDNCVDTILGQVRLLRQIASEFSSFGSAPKARPTPTSIEELLHEVVDPYQLGSAGRVRFDVAIDPSLPPVSVDRMLIGRAITNIIENALHAMPAGGDLRVSAQREDSRVVVRVSDTGVGMDEEAAARIFEPYFSTKATGTGLGLSIARRNVELHGGTISVESERGVGTTVTVTLPLAEGRAAADSEEPVGAQASDAKT
ncbi:MAG TPA: ATP-binding protein [Vicinamibacterales bacterium]